MRFSPLPSALGASERFSPKDLVYCTSSSSFSSSSSSSSFYVPHDAQGVPKVEAEPFSMTNTDFSTVLMNSCLEIGFL